MYFSKHVFFQNLFRFLKALIEPLVFHLYDVDFNRPIVLVAVRMRLIPETAMKRADGLAE